MPYALHSVYSTGNPMTTCMSLGCMTCRQWHSSAHGIP